MTNPLPKDQRISVDDAPLREWLSRTPSIWERRLQRHVLTAESVDAQGVSLGEKVVRLCHRFADATKNDARQDPKLTHLLETCQDPRSAAAVWLRAVLPWQNGSMSRAERLDCLAQRLAGKLLGCNEKDRLAWATLAMRDAARICKPSGRKDDLPEEDDVALVRLISVAWTAIPENLVYQGRSMLPAHQTWVTTSPVPWKPFCLHLIDVFSCRKWNSPAPTPLLPVHLWMAPAFDDLTLADQKIAQLHCGLVPSSLVGHRSFLAAIENNTPWPKDPRIVPAVEWIKKHNPYLAPFVENVALQQQTQSPSSIARARTRL